MGVNNQVWRGNILLLFPPASPGFSSLCLFSLGNHPSDQLSLMLLHRCFYSDKNVQSWSIQYGRH
jgi:hypothetical protein